MTTSPQILTSAKGKIKEEKASIPKPFYLNSTNGSSSRKPPTMTQVDISQYTYYKQSQHTDMKNMQSQPTQKKISCVPPKLLATLILCGLSDSVWPFRFYKTFHIDFMSYYIVCFWSECLCLAVWTEIKILPSTVHVIMYHCSLS